VPTLKNEFPENLCHLHLLLHNKKRSNNGKVLETLDGLEDTLQMPSYSELWRTVVENGDTQHS
jgi:hypothetical protein